MLYKSVTATKKNKKKNEFVVSLINLQWHEEQKEKKKILYSVCLVSKCCNLVRVKRATGEKGCLSLRIKKNRYLYIFIIYEMYDRNICANAPKMSRGKKNKNKKKR